MSALFGPGGNCEEFAKSGLKSSLYAPQWVKDYGLDAYEYEAGRGIHASPSMLAEMGENAKRLGINMSFHTPYFISLSSVEKEKRVKSVGYNGIRRRKRAFGGIRYGGALRLLRKDNKRAGNGIRFRNTAYGR